MKAAVITFPGSNCDRDLAGGFEAAGIERAKAVFAEDKMEGGALLGTGFGPKK